MRSRLPIRSADLADAEWIAGFLRDRWNATTIVVHGDVIEAAKLPALIAENRQGLATYRRLDRDAELVTLDADPIGIGTGTALVEMLVERLRDDGCGRLWLTTTNDKVSALCFYLRRRFRLIQVRLGAVDAARKLKPSIPSLGEHSIPIHDELDLCRIVDPRIVDDERVSPPWKSPISATSQAISAIRQAEDRTAETVERCRTIREADMVDRSGTGEVAVVVRPAKPQDRPRLREAIVELQDYERNLHATRLLGREIGDAYLTSIEHQTAKDGAILVAELAGHFAGFVAGWIEQNDAVAETIDSNRFGYISDLCVMRAYRGQRIASRLLTAIEEHLASAGITRLRICSLAGNASARSSYERAGFTPYEITYEKSLAIPHGVHVRRWND